MTGISARRNDIMPHDHDTRENGVSRRHALECMIWTGTGVLWTVLGGAPKSLNLLGRAEAATATAQTKPTIPIIVKDITSFYWQTVLAGARKAGQDLGVNVPELGAQSEFDINGQISILENAVSSNPAAVVIAPTQFAALGKPIDEAAKKIKIIGIDTVADSRALTSFLTTDNVQAGRIAADILAERIQKTYADAEGDVALITSLPGVISLDQRANGFKEQLAAKYGALSIVADKVADGQASTGRKIMTEIIAANPELRGVFVSNLIMAQGAAQAVAESKTNKTGDKINLVGFDSDDQLVKFLQDGTIAALVVQDPFRMGYDGVKTALAASKGEQVPTTVNIGANLVTKANINSARSQELLNPKIK
jgi:ribose transport system substrate-binding protein